MPGISGSGGSMKIFKTRGYWYNNHVVNYPKVKSSPSRSFQESFYTCKIKKNIQYFCYVLFRKVIYLYLPVTMCFIPCNAFFTSRIKNSMKKSRKTNGINCITC